MKPNQAGARVAVAAMSAVGVVTAHVLAYRVAHAGDAARAHVLDTSGHGYWDVAVLVALAGLLVAVGVQIVFGHRNGPRVPSRVGVWGRLMAIQALTFVALESIERVVEGPQQLVLLLGEPAFWLALPLLAVTAALGGVVLVVALRAGASLALSGRTIPPRRRVALVGVPDSPPFTSRVGVSNTHERAPPALLFN